MTDEKPQYDGLHADEDAMEAVRRTNPALYGFLASMRKDVEEYYDASVAKSYVIITPPVQGGQTTGPGIQ